MYILVVRKNIEIVFQKEYKNFEDLMEKFELPQEMPCNINLGDVFYTDGIVKPDNLCDSAWDTLKPFIKSIIDEKPLFNNWMKDESKAVVSCNDGFRPTTFLIEKI